MAESSESRQAREHRLFLDELTQTRLEELEQVVAREQHQRQLAESLREIGVVLSSSLDQAEVLSKILAQLAVIIRHDGGAIFLHEAESLILLHGIGPAAQAHEGDRIPLISQNPAVRAFYNEEPLILNNGADEQYWLEWPEGDTLYAWIGVPLIIEEEVVGVLTLDRYEPDTYTEADVQTLQIFGEQAALAIRNARLYEALRESEARFRMAIKNFPDGSIALLDRDFRFLLIEGQEWQTVRMDPAQMVGRTIYETLPFESASNAEPHLQAAFAGKKQIYEYSSGGQIYTNTALPIVSETGQIETVMVISQNITERRQVEEIQARLAAIVESSDDAIIGKTLEGIVTSWNSGAEAIYGYTAAEMVDQSITTLLPPHRKGEIANLLDRLRQGQSIHHFETTRLTKADREIIVSLTLSPIRDSTGQVVGASTIARDITERKRVEMALRESEERLRTVWNTSADALALSDTEGIVLMANPAYLKLYGYTAEEVIDQPFNIIFPEAQRDWAMEQYKAVFASPIVPPTFHSVVRRADGTERIVETTIGFITQDGERTAMLSNIRDVTEHRRTEDALRESEAQQRAILEAIPDVIFRLNRDGVYLDAQGAEGMTEVPVTGRIGRTVEELLPLDLAKKIRGNIEKVLATREIIYSEHQLHWDEQIHFYETRYVAINEDEVIMIIRDVTEQRHLEEQLRQSQKMEAVGQLAGGMAHHYNNMLTAIMGYVSLSLTELPSDHPIAKDLERIQNTTQRAATLTHQLLTFTSRQPARLEVVNLNDLIHNAEHLLRSLLSSAVEVEMNLAPDLALAQIDGAQFEQVLFNLVGNARDAMPLQGGKLLIQTANLTLEEVGEIPAGDYVQVIVRDNGHGIPEAIKDRIFDPFFTTKEIGQGTGLGLSTCYGIITQHHGYITVESKSGEGTTFYVYLPCHEARPITTPTDHKPELAQGKETVLLVEDNDDVRDLIRHVLQQQGYTLLEAENGQAVLSLLDKQPPANLDLLLTDVVMPGMGGMALAKELRTRYRQLKVLMISGYNDDILSQQDILDLEIAFLAKPFSPAKLIQTVRAVLDTLPQ